MHPEQPQTAAKSSRDNKTKRNLSNEECPGAVQFLLQHQTDGKNAVKEAASYFDVTRVTVSCTWRTAK